MWWWLGSDHPPHSLGLNLSVLTQVFCAPIMGRSSSLALFWLPETLQVYSRVGLSDKNFHCDAPVRIVHRCWLKCVRACRSS
mmetsp:Transcript_28524/g.68606  ORF Transcript_28524/g.68606 Transcript_28524/m.68606 type:complete len:82 (-) Transcript_28524:79-324(-)